MGEKRLSYITINDEQVNSLIHVERLQVYQEKIKVAHEQLHERTGLGNDALGWINFPDDFSEAELTEIKSCAQKIQEQSDVFIVIGVGGSYLGAKAAIELLSHSFYN